MRSAGHISSPGSSSRLKAATRATTHGPLAAKRFEELVARNRMNPHARID